MTDTVNDRPGGEQPRQRARRPDQAVDNSRPGADAPEAAAPGGEAPPEVEKVDAEAAAPGGPEPADEGVNAEIGATDRDEGPAPSATLNFDKPFARKGTQVIDAKGRVVCMVASAHLLPAAREAAAQMIADSLNRE